MRTLLLLLGWLLLNALSPMLDAKPHDGQIVRGRTFEGVIFTPEMFLGGAFENPIYAPGPTWTPSEDLVLKAEAALPAAIAKMVMKPARGPNFPKFYTTKNGTSLNFFEPPDLMSDKYEEDNDFVRDMAPRLAKYKRQYFGLTIKGKKVLLMSFIYDPTSWSDPSYLSDWKQRWVNVLDGGDCFWRVIYDPFTGFFSDWECNGDA